MSKLLIDERPLTVLPTLVKLVGMEKAVILQQIHWLTGLPKSGMVVDGEKWVWGSHEEWCEEYFPFWKPDTLRKHLVKLQKDGYIFIAQFKGFDRTNHYRINHAMIESPIRHDHATSKRNDLSVSIRHDHAICKQDDHAGSNGHDHATLNGHDHAASYIEETSHKTSTETSTEEGIVGATPTPPLPEAWPEFLNSFCWVCHGHQDTKSLTEAQFGALTSEGKRIRADGYTVADLREWTRVHWFQGWQWKKDKQRPKPDVVRSSIPILREEDESKSERKYGYGLDAPAQSPAVDVEFYAEPEPPPAESVAATPHLALGLWEKALLELKRQWPPGSDAPEWLEGSTLVQAADVAGVPLYQVRVLTPDGVSWLNNRAGVLMRRTLSGLMKQRLLVEVVCVEAELAAEMVISA